ncbi:MAG: hypothetical protein ACXVP5_09710 [Tumebacillaceae bacterium]
MRKLVLAALLLTVSVCFTGCGGQMAADAHNKAQGTMQMDHMQMDMTSQN